MAKKNDKQTANTIGVIQMSMESNTAGNVKKAAAFAETAAKQGAEIICLPEMYRSQYFCQKEHVDLFDLAEPIDGESFSVFSKIARKRKVVLIVPIFERHAPGIYFNSALIIDDFGDLIGVYRKMHIPDDPLYYEKFYFSPGDRDFQAHRTNYGTFGTLICWDQWFPEGARLTALRGATTLFFPTAIGFHPKEKEEFGAAQQDAWITVQRGHAIANGVYIAAANRVGFERPFSDLDGLEFWGASFIADPQGVILAQASGSEEEIVIAEINLAHLEDIRRNWPFFRDRRIDAYDGISKRFF